MLDYRLAWRWLLPCRPNQRLYFSGFDNGERAFCHAAFTSMELVEEPRQADGWIINAERTIADLAGRNGRSIGDNVGWVAVIGSGSSIARWRRLLARGFAGISEYGLLPARDPRVLVPLGNLRLASIGLRLHRPGRWFARCALRLSRLAVGLGVLFHLRQQVLLVATRKRHVWPLGAIQAELATHFEDLGWNYVLYIGMPYDNCKTTVLPVGDTEPDVLIKMGASPQARGALKNEAEALMSLGESALREQVPRIKGLVDNEHGFALYQEYRARRQVHPQTMQSAVVDFLARLSTLDRRSQPLGDVLADLPAVNTATHEASDRDAIVIVLRWLEKQADKGVAVWEHRSHGDFSWNCSWTDKGFFVFDWEESRCHALAFTDAFNYVVAPMIQFGRKPDPVLVLNKALDLAAQVAKRRQSLQADVKIHFALWVMANRGKHPIYGALMKHMAQAVT